VIDQKHIINKQVLEVKLSSKKDAHLIQDAFSKAYRNKIIPVIERIADRFTRNGEIIIIDKLEVDVGGISIDSLYNDLPQRFAKNLEELLIEKLHNRELELENISTDPNGFDFHKESKKTVRIKTDVENSLEILNNFLRTGTLPWWSSRNIHAIAEELLEKSPDRVKILLLKLLKNQSIRKRFVYQFTEKTINKSLFVLTPNATPFLLDLIEKFTAVQAIHPFINLSQNTFKEEIWNSILTYTTENHAFLNTNQLNEIELINQIFSKLITQTSNESVNPKDLFNFLSKISDSITLSKQQIQSLAKFDSNIKTLLNKLREAEISADLMANSVTHSKSDKAQIELFTYFLQTGKIPFNDGKYSDSTIQLIAEELLENSPENIRILLLNQLTDIAVRKRFIHQFSDEFIFKTLETLIPSAASATVELIKTINKIQLSHPYNNIPRAKFREDIWNLILTQIINNQQSIYNNNIIRQTIINHFVKISNGNISFNEFQDKIEFLKKNEKLDDIDEINFQNNTNCNTANSIEKMDVVIENNLLQSSKTTESDEKDYAYDKTYHPQPEIESKHIINAGLALLWPFLNIFFVRLNIVKDKKFVSNEAAQKAVHLIQYLVTEKEETPEHELLFNKLLCGIDIYEPIPLGFKITENEKEECNALLQSVIDNWTVLKNTSIHALRITFLQKEGILSKQPNGWKLAIERTTIDVLLDRLPWSISMIALPWSNEMIYVEW